MPRPRHIEFLIGCYETRINELILLMANQPRVSIEHELARKITVLKYLKEK